MEPNNCPFCGSDNTKFEWTSKIDDVVTGGFVACKSDACDTQGPEADTEQEAIAAWNKPGAYIDVLKKELYSSNVNIGEYQNQINNAKDRIKELEEVAYCAEGFLESEAETNYGDAQGWKRQLSIAIDNLTPKGE